MIPVTIKLLRNKFRLEPLKGVIDASLKLFEQTKWIIENRLY